uniref:Major facilitator superfamily (MFS) profile domain-containing protein n=1 Tax=Trichobilharzia regenti TaxID=157069 RepID=A0AA85IY96_TRIRE|nr:unnamed protein product [Trichobilharzia regenti]
MDAEITEKSEFDVAVKRKPTNVCLQSIKAKLSSRKMIAVIVFIAILLDNMLLTAIVPIAPKILALGHKDEGIPEKGMHDCKLDNSTSKVFAFSEHYYLLLVARAIQGIGSACSSVAGMGMLATAFTDDKERGRAFAFALSGLALGVMIGPPFGGVTFQFISKEAPFLILAALIMFDGLLQLITLKPTIKREVREGSSLINLLIDPYILIAAGTITFGNLGMAILEPTLPLWMKIQMNSEEWEQGVLFLAASVSYLIGANIFGPISHRIGRGNSAGLGLLICGASLIGLPFSTRIEHLIAPMFCLGFAIGMIDSSMMPIMGYLVDLRHVGVYGSVYAIADIAFCCGFVAGPLLSTVLIRALGFKW